MKRLAKIAVGLITEALQGRERSRPPRSMEIDEIARPLRRRGARAAAARIHPTAGEADLPHAL